MGKSPCCEANQELKKGPWTPQEDQKLIAYIQQHGHGSWRVLPKKAGLQRCGKSCRLRWINYLRPDIKRGKISLEEERTIIQLHALLGNRWSAIATYLPKRTDNEIKNYWNTHLKKRLAMMGVDPETHMRHPKNASNLSHMAQWESARLEAETRLAKDSKTNRQVIDEPAAFSAEQILKKMPTTFAPPRCLDVLKAWHNRLFSESLQGSNCAPCFGFGEIHRTDRPKSDSLSGLFGEFCGGSEDLSSDEALLSGCLESAVADCNIHQDDTNGDGYLIENSFDVMK